MAEQIYFDEDRTQRSWQLSILLFAASATVLLTVFARTASAIVAQWYGSATFGHGFLVLPVSLGLVWLKRKELSRCEPQPAPLALALLAGLAAFWLMARLALAPVGEDFALVAMLPALAWLLVGSDLAKRLLFPLLFLFFMVPVGDSLVPALQSIAAWFAVKGLELARVPVVFRGYLISVPSGTWVVAKECSGLRFLIAGTMLGCLYANVMYKSWRKQLVFVVSTVVFSVVANGLRVFGVIMLGQWVGIRVASGVDHLIYGWVLFTFVTAVLFSAGWRWRDPADDVLGESTLQDTSAASAGGAVDAHRREPSRRALRLGFALAMATVILLASTSVSAHWLDRRASGTALLKAPEPVVLAPWHISEVAGNTWEPEFRGATPTLATYSDGSHDVDLFVAYYTQEQPGASLVSDMNSLANPGWMITAKSSTRTDLDRESLDVAENVIQRGQVRRLVWSWYWVDGRFTDNAYSAKLGRLRAILLDGPRTSAFIAVASDFAHEPGAAEQALQSFLGHASFGGELLRGSE